MAAAAPGPLARPFPPFDPGKLVPDVIALRGQGFLWLGLLVVVVTPAARVLASLIGFALERDRRMVGLHRGHGHDDHGQDAGKDDHPEEDLEGVPEHAPDHEHGDDQVGQQDRRNR